jgi:hypothetical protein
MLSQGWHHRQAHTNARMPMVGSWPAKTAEGRRTPGRGSMSRGCPTAGACNTNRRRFPQLQRSDIFVAPAPPIYSPAPSGATYSAHPIPPFKGLTSLDSTGLSLTTPPGHFVPFVLFFP